MAAKKTRGKTQLGKGRWSPSIEAAQIRNMRAGRPGPTWAVTSLSGLEGDTTGGRQRQKERSGLTTRWSKSRIAKENASRTAGETKGPRGGDKKKAVTKQKQVLSGKGAAQRRADVAAETRKDNIRKSKARGTYNVRRSGGAAFNPKLLGRSSPTDFIRGGRGPSGIPRKLL